MDPGSLTTSLAFGFLSNVASDSISEEFSSLIRKRVANYLVRRRRGQKPPNADIERAVRKSGLLAAYDLLSQVQEVYLRGKEHSNRAGYLVRFSKAEEYLNSQLNLLEEENWEQRLPSHVELAFGSRDILRAVNCYSETVAEFNEDEEQFSESESADLTDKALEKTIRELDNYDSAMTAAYIHEIECGADWRNHNYWFSLEEFRGFVDPVFNDSQAGWPYLFRFYLAEEIKDNNRFRHIATALQLSEIGQKFDSMSAAATMREQMTQSLLTNIDSQLIDLWTNINGKFKELNSKQDEQWQNLLKRLDSCVRKDLPANDFGDWVREFESTNTNDAAGIHFTNRSDAFLGREDELKKICSALLKKNSGRPCFRWLAVCGDAGVGKSRFALEFLREFGEKSQWYYVGSLRSPSKNDDLENIALRGPALIVADYAGSIDRLPDLFREFADRDARGQLYHDIRVLVLERRTNDQIFYRLNGGIGAKDRGAELVSKSEIMLPPEGSSNRVARLTLSAIEEDLLLQLMNQRIERAREIAPSFSPRQEFDKKTLLERLDYFDKDRRILFALITAEVLQSGTLCSDKVTSINGDTPESRRIELALHFLNKEQGTLHNVAEQIGINKELERRFRNLAFLATITQGLPGSFLQNDDIPNEVKVLLPSYGEFSEFDEFYMRMSLQTSVTSRRTISEENITFQSPSTIAGVQPDFLGEWFVLSSLLEARESPVDEAALLSLVNYAWELNPLKIAAFAKICFDEFPTRLRACQYLRYKRRANTRAEQEAVVVQMAGIVLSLLKAVYTGTPNLEQVQCAFDILDQIDAPLLELVECDQDGDIADAVETTVLQASNLINRTINPFTSRSIEPENRKLSIIVEKQELGDQANREPKPGEIKTQFGREFGVSLTELLEPLGLRENDLKGIVMFRVKNLTPEQERQAFAKIESRIISQRINIDEIPLEFRLEELEKIVNELFTE